MFDIILVGDLTMLWFRWICGYDVTLDKLSLWYGSSVVKVSEKKFRTNKEIDDLESRFHLLKSLGFYELKPTKENSEKFCWISVIVYTYVLNFHSYKTLIWDDDFDVFVKIIKNRFQNSDLRIVMKT